MSSDLILWSGSSREVAKVDRAIAREKALVRGRARVVEAQYIASVETLHAVASTAMSSGASLTQQAQALASAVPGSEALSAQILGAVGLAVTDVLRDAARDLRP